MSVDAVVYASWELQEDDGETIAEFSCAYLGFDLPADPKVANWLNFP